MGDRSLHERYVTLISGIERRFAVSRWWLGDVPLWPLARFELYLAMHRATFAGMSQPRRSLTWRAGAALARPLVLRWRGARRDRAHQLLDIRPAHAVLLGDGVTLDRLDGAYHDRFGEPVMAALERRGRATFLMQQGDLSRLPWHRPSFAVQAMDLPAAVLARLLGGEAELPDHAAVLRHLAEEDVGAAPLAVDILVRRARRVAAAAVCFERVLRRVQPRLGFVVNYAAGAGPAFLLACRRRGILSVDLQRCPTEGAPMAYGWSDLPEGGYTTLPAVFWTWQSGAAQILPSRWHRELHGGHLQIAPFLDDRSAVAKLWDARFRQVASHPAEREILVALQPIGGQRDRWNALADVVEASPAGWRWWIRRHPAMCREQEAEFGSLLSGRLRNAVIDPPLPLPALLRHADALVSMASGAAVEASMLAVPALFLSEEARGPFRGLIESGAATVFPVADLQAAIARLPSRPSRRERRALPDLDECLGRLESMASDYAFQCGESP